ncbi:ferredoxin [Actinoallomurus iriomotensis]|uniref:Ferredoxin n=1 Tax=Actinoallomurus iriomotensis TaxID=478107 RepID=A0A9W6RZ47_9ACTN|nr:ferredoxin [Actinoallomurus iriomotensis]GLY85451.1 ferredoxin [Actinoallomurus iriomotensis]
MTWEIEVDARTCIGSGICAGTAPDHFKVVDGVSHPLRPETAPADPALDAAESCPVEAITIRDKETGRTLAPEE